MMTKTGRPRGRPKSGNPPVQVKTVRLHRDTHSAIVSYAGKIQTASGEPASINTAVKKLLDKERAHA